MDRRAALRSLGIVTTGLGLGAVAGCASHPTAATPVATPAGGGSSPTGTAPAGSTPGSVGTAEAASVQVARAVPGPGAVADGATVVRDFTADLYRRLAATPGDLVCSPYSVAVALAMTRAGAAGRTAAQLDTVLHSPGRKELGAGMNALDQLVGSRSGKRHNASGVKTTVTVDVAKSLWAQRSERLQTPFLDTLARDYGAGMNLVDYRADSDGARTAINAWTAAHTHGLIPDLVPPGILDDLTRLVLVNAIHLKAPWLSSFDSSRTEDAPFTPAGAAAVPVPAMHATFETLPYRSAMGWQAVDLPYAGSELAMALVLPAAGRLGALEQSLDGAALHRLLTGFAPSWIRLTLPRWTSRTAISLNEDLSALGMTLAFDAHRADFSAMTTEEQLHVSAVLHQATITVDEQGTEATAATAVGVAGAAARAGGPTPVVFDRPFLYVVHDVATATPLFIGRVADPSAAA